MMNNQTAGFGVFCMGWFESYLTQTNKAYDSILDLIV